MSRRELPQCHYFHVSKCYKSKPACIFKHTEPALGKCPNVTCRICDTINAKKGEKKFAPIQQVKQARRIEKKINERGQKNYFKQTIIQDKQQTIKADKKDQQKVMKPIIILQNNHKDRQQVKQNVAIIKQINQTEKKTQKNINSSINVQIPKVQTKLQVNRDQEYEQMEELQNQLYEARLRDAHQDLQIFKPIQKIFQAKLSLDLMFILDCTGSMSSWIEACKRQLNSIIDQVLFQHEGAKINIGMIAYRDIKDRDRFQVLNFTQNTQQVLNFIKKLRASGGADTPEDIAGAFNLVLKQNWKSNAKYAVLITDAPCHGKQYHDCDDDYPKGDPNNLIPQNLISQMVDAGINLYGIKMNNSTDKMFRIFSQVYQQKTKKPLQIANLGSNTTNFGFYIASTVTATLSASVVNSDVNYIKKALIILKEGQNLKKLTVQQKLDQLLKVSNDPTIIEKDTEKAVEKADLLQFDHKMKQLVDWNNLQNSQSYQCIQHTYFIVKDKNIPINWKKPLVQSSQITSKVKICKYPFSDGSMRYAFYAFDTEIKQKLVVKRSKRISDNNLKTMSKDLQLMYICQQIVNTFNDVSIDLVPDTRLLLTFVNTFIIQIKNQDQRKEPVFYYAENYIDGTYEKYNNNAGWVNNNKVSQSSLVSQAFSHYSYQFTKGYLMIVDLQGASGILTDPQIHCLDNKRFGSGNLGYQGILKFFFNHKCNNYCGKLGLIHPKKTSTLPANFNFFDKQPVQPYDYDKKVHSICDLCKKPFETTAGFVFSKRVQDLGKYCRPCDQKRKKSMKKGKCVNCFQPFVSSEYWFKMMRTDFPTLCGDCRKKRRQIWRKQLQLNKGEGEVKTVGGVSTKVNLQQLSEIKGFIKEKDEVLKTNLDPTSAVNQISKIKLIWRNFDFDISIFEDSEDFKKWMSSFGLVFGRDYQQLKKVTNLQTKKVRGRLLMLQDRLNIVNKKYKGSRQIQFQLYNKNK